MSTKIWKLWGMYVYGALTNGIAVALDAPTWAYVIIGAIAGIMIIVLGEK